MVDDYESRLRESQVKQVVLAEDSEAMQVRLEDKMRDISAQHELQVNTMKQREELAQNVSTWG